MTKSRQAPQRYRLFSPLEACLLLEDFCSGRSSLCYLYLYLWFCASARGVSGPVRAFCVLSEVEIWADFYLYFCTTKLRGPQ